MRIAVVGTGYVGLVAGVCLAESGADVVCIDVDQAKLRLLEKGEVPFFEPGLESMLQRNWPQRITFSDDLAASIKDRQIVFVVQPHDAGGHLVINVFVVSRLPLDHCPQTNHGREPPGFRHDR